MTAFIPYAFLLLLATVAVLAWPLWRQQRDASTDRTAANRAIYRSEMDELEREFADGNLSENDLTLARNELQRRLLADAAGDEQAVPDAQPSRRLAIALMVMVPILAVGGYATLGEPQAMDPEARQAPPPQVTAAQIEGMVAGLAKRLQENPGDTKGWFMLARSYKALDRLPEAAAAYAKVESEVAKNPDLLTDYAEILGAIQKSFQGKPATLLTIRSTRAASCWPESPRWKGKTTRPPSPIGSACFPSSNRDRRWK
ncbi:MAG TPA: c-type cytochrome biogenesis protein CcmI [Rhodocyclaceae bacterium]|nr:c-type cytochrome biogenesis protein CcmI [Rhodocyclaceae bacterium]